MNGGLRKLDKLLSCLQESIHTDVFKQAIINNYLELVVFGQVI